ncbi:MAG: NERD domain-containing protein [Nitrospirae bacterium]|nr:NERD domain-containing protein [Nitrospirota bacterium]
MNFRKGVIGEAVVGYLLDIFPDDYYVIHDLTTPFGNLDHVVVGPTGAYIIDAKNWRGVVTANKNGELFLNGNPTHRQEIKNLWRRIIGVKEKIKILSSMDPFIRGLFVFTSAHVDAKWGTTGYIHCISDEQLYDYIVQNKTNKRLSKKKINAIAQAFFALAVMDKTFVQINNTSEKNADTN